MARGRHIPTVASSRLAAELRALRERAGFTWEAVAEEMGWSESKVYRIENDKSRILARDVKRLIKLYEVDDAKAEALLELARRAREPDWWHRYSGAIPEWFQVYVVLEASASEIRGYESELVPGIMQTEDYARAILSTAPILDSDEEIENKVAVRVNRQARLTGDNPLNIWMVINEAVIRRVVGGPKVMRGQLERLVELAKLRNVTLQVLPFESGAHPGMHGAFKLMRFPADGNPDKVYMELEVGGLYTQKTHEVERYSLIFDHLRARALGPEQTIKLIRQVAAELNS
ncbi:helix-turn-helix domain-containing protein [Thermomonospora cellulosilytica]|uniref:Transcriptional regulator with XRE-family HTH domain n=2 Tax=Thermomonospora TaxID=2019 RepID=A0A7W3N5M6_9ACTN|nr:helix-turn-helix transcriptional regulator [Thermomonospora cellulosilytica]MBA9008006.1 transcriptional regulator with XRE-family HTH domain [Thermomonospora cellulosilytica]